MTEGYFPDAQLNAGCRQPQTDLAVPWSLEMKALLAAALLDCLIVQYNRLSTSRLSTFWWGGGSQEKRASSLKGFTEVPPLLLTYDWSEFPHTATPNTEI